MAFASVPKNSKTQIKKAGDILINENSPAKDLQWAIQLAQRWRACHAYPINTFQATLRRKLKNFPKNPIVAQRLKRMPTIINKLKRFSSMQLITMQDIGGVRAVVGSVSDVYKLGNEYQKNKRLAHELTHVKDYIKEPRDEDGYRSLHLIYKYKNLLTPDYNGLRLELQIRTKLQHIWATAVETMGTFLGQALKSREGDQEWLDFFSVTSAAFTHMEKTPCIPRFRNFSKNEIFREVSNAEANLRALEKMKGFSTAVDAIVKQGGKKKGWFYHLIILNSLKKSVQIHPYDRDSFKQAVEDYSKVEAEAAQGAKIEPVLVSAGPISSLRRAYPNFFLDIGDFVKIVDDILTIAKKKI